MRKRESREKRKQEGKQPVVLNDNIKKYDNDSLSFPDSNNVNKGFLRQRKILEYL